MFFAVYFLYCFAFETSFTKHGSVNRQHEKRKKLIKDNEYHGNRQLQNKIMAKHTTELVAKYPGQNNADQRYRKHRRDE